MQEYNYDTGQYEENGENITCHTCSTIIYDSDPYSFDRQGNQLCETCCTGLVEVLYAKYHNDGIYFDVLPAAIPPEEVVTLQVAPKSMIIGAPKPAVIEERRYDKTNLPDFVELYEGTYRYVPGKRIKF